MRSRPDQDVTGHVHECWSHVCNLITLLSSVLYTALYGHLSHLLSVRVFLQAAASSKHAGLYAASRTVTIIPWGVPQTSITCVNFRGWL
jgi:hypothetical protein